MKRKLIVTLKILVSLGILAIVFSRIDLQQVWTQVSYLSLPFVAFALLYYTVCQLLSCWRWQIVLRATGHCVPIGSLLASYFAGMFVSIFLPGSFGGDVYRSYQIGQRIKDTEVAIASVFLERFTGLAAVFALALIGLPPAFKLLGHWDIILLFITCAAVISGGTILIASPRLLIWAEPWLHKLRLKSLAGRIAKIQVILRKFAQHRQALDGNWYVPSHTTSGDFLSISTGAATKNSDFIFGTFNLYTDFHSCDAFAHIIWGFRGSRRIVGLSIWSDWDWCRASYYAISHFYIIRLDFEFTWRCNFTTRFGWI
jgi:Lysylphosphatidylglycerol synthase TM region